MAKIIKKGTKGSGDWEKDLEKEAEKESAREKAGGVGGHQVSIKGRRFTFGGENLGRELKASVVDYVYINAWYDSKYKEDKASIPACFSLSDEEEGMTPHEDSVKPQADTCAECPHNEWGSGRGRAKACRQGRRLALIHEDDLEDVAEAEVAMLSVPPTSAKAWGKHVKDTKAKLARPPYAVLTKLGFDMDADYPTLTFEAEEKLGKETVMAIKERSEEFRELLMTPYDASSYEEGDDEDEDEDEDEKPAKGKAAPKKAVKKAPAKKSKSDEDDEDDEDEDDEDEDEDEDEKPAKGKAAPKKASKSDEDDDDEDEDEDEDDDEPVKKGKKSRFSK